MSGTNHLHHEDGCFQEYIALDADYLTVLPEDVDERVMGPVLCAGLTAYKVLYFSLHDASLVNPMLGWC